MTTDADQPASVRAMIESAFAGTEYPGDGDITPQTYSNQRESTYFRGRRWEELDRKGLCDHYDAVAILTPDALQYYLPAFMLAVLEYPHRADVVYDALEFVLSVPSDRRDLLVRHLSEPQRQALRAFLENRRPSAIFPASARQAIAFLDSIPRAQN